MITKLQNKKEARVAVLIPAFCEEQTVGGIVEAARRYLPDVIVVDDASTDQTAARAEAAGATVMKRDVNGGKGASLTEGFRYVLEHGFDAVITLDADGFHDPDEIPKFLETGRRTRLPVLVGNRMAAARCLTPVRRWTIRIMSSLLDRLQGIYVPDPACGFRLYRCDVLPFLLSEEKSICTEFETLLNIASRRVRVGTVLISKCSTRHKSLISPFRDLFRFVRLLQRHYRVVCVKFCNLGF